MIAGKTARVPGSLPTTIEDLDDVVRLAWLAAIVESSDDAIISKNLDGRILSWNAGATRIFGYRPDEVIGKHITIIVPPELYGEEQEILGKLRRGESIDHFDTTRLTKDGRKVQVSLTVSPVRDSQGTIIGASKMARDVTERKRAEASLLQSEQRLAAEAEGLAALNMRSALLWQSRSLREGVAEMLATAIELLGADAGCVQLRNASGEFALMAQRGLGECGAAVPDPTGLDELVIADAELDGPFEAQRRWARAAGYRALVSVPMIAADDTILGAISTLSRSPQRPADQQLRRLTLYLRQATDFIRREQLEHGLRQSEEALREADQRKDEFLALLAHELRNPLAPIRYALAAAKKPGRSPEQRQRTDAIIERQVEHMSRLLDDLLDISRITHGSLELKKARTELTSVIGAAIETARPMLDAKKHALSLVLPKEPVRLDADAVRLAQAFSNLLINAAKYTDAGGRIQLQALREGDEAVISIRDNGIGIAAEMMPRLFRLFSQAHAPHARAEGGLGVGLALVRGLVTLHGGTVTAKSEGPGRGTEFVVRLPTGMPSEEPSRAEQATEAAATGGGMRIMVVDDNRDAADTCAMVLELSGHHVQTAYTAAAALARGATFRPQALVLDIGLPDLDGYQLAQQVRASDWGRDATLIAVTGWGQDEDRLRALTAGFDYHLTKPIAAEQLEALLQPRQGIGS
ncbi:MAG TPA: PAS domain S-box protein [Candidatus Dormibacteraeota bacterium]|nr:PAS domain S-box protein [Candidatus Dormibacteraeota bacterium]